MKKEKNRIVLIFLIVGVLLLIPLIAMQFTNEVNWTIFDFLVAATLLLTAGFAINFVISRIKITSQKIAICAAIIAVFLLIWVELAVGIFGTPFAGS